MESSNYYQDYATLDAQIKELTAKKEALREEILKQMREHDAEKVETLWGKFTCTMLKTWEYPSEVVELGEEFKAAKAKAESTGEATYTEKPSLRFTETKI